MSIRICKLILSVIVLAMSFVGEYIVAVAYCALHNLLLL